MLSNRQLLAISWLSTFTLLSLGSPSGATAQQATSETQQQSESLSGRKGFWIGFGFGGGLSSPGTFVSDGERGAAAYFRMGGTVNDHVLFGGQTQVWWRQEQPGFDTQRVNVTATALIYPSTTSGLFFKGGFGVTTVEEFVVVGTGIGTTLGVGYDFRLGRNFYVTPNLDLLIHLLENSTSSSLLFTLGLVWH